jgi:hypothetical protein
VNPSNTVGASSLRSPGSSLVACASSDVKRLRHSQWRPTSAASKPRTSPASTYG